VRLTLAPHVEFNEELHEYHLRGKRLSGVTGLISKKLGLRLPQEFLDRLNVIRNAPKKCEKSH
jgi:hypothetical protein